MNERLDLPKGKTYKIQDPSLIPLRFYFHGKGNKEVGTLFEKDSKLHFEGDVEESAEIFFEQVKSIADNYIRRQKIKAEELLKHIDLNFLPKKNDIRIEIEKYLKRYYTLNKDFLRSKNYEIKHYLE